MIRLLKFPVFIVFVLCCGLVQALTPDDPVADREHAMTFYSQGKDDDAIKILQAFVKRYTMDARAWHYLGLALDRKGEKVEARNAHEKAARSALELTREYLVSAEPDLQCVMVRPLRSMLTESAESADKYLELSDNSSPSKIADWRAIAEELRHYFKICGDPGSRGDQTDKDDDAITDTKGRDRARITNKPSPEYTEEARSHETSGTVVLFAMLDGDGIVKAIVPTVSLPNGLTAQAVKAARGIKFIPASKNGKPVPQFLRIEYKFNTN